MNHRLGSPMRWLVSVVAILAITLPAMPALAQSSTSQATGRGQVTIDAPSGGTTIRNGAQIDVGGWAVDRNGPGTGVDEVRVYLDGPMDGNGTMLGAANYGGSRPDVAQVLGSSAFATSGFDFLWTPTRLSGGSHTLYVYAHSINDGWTSSTVSITVDAPAVPAPSGSGYGSGGSGNGGYGTGPGYGQGYDPGYGPMPPYGYGDDFYGDRGGRACIMIFPPPPGCGGPILPVPPLYPPYYPGIPPVAPGGIGAPTGVVVAGTSGTTVTLSFTPVAGATSYRVFQSVAFAGFVPATLGTQTASSVVVTGLTPNTPYTFYVVAVNANGIQGAQSAPVTATTTVGP